MELTAKLEILAGAAKYDASCASSGSPSSQRSACCDTPGSFEGKRHVSPENRTGPGSPGGFGVRVPAGVCHSWTGDGRCVSLLKVLYSNVCRFDCAYCVNRVSSDVERASFKSDELVELTAEFYRRNYIEGLFLSSGVFSDPDIVMEKLITVAKTLRKNMNFNGYIHLKLIPGSGEAIIREAGLWADRLSANIELPTEKSLKNLAPQKSGKLIFGAMNEVSGILCEIEEDRRHQLKSAPVYAPAGQSTQLIVGASGEDDRTIIGLSGALYRKYSLRRVYYSAYMPVAAMGGIPDPRLPDYPEQNGLFPAQAEPGIPAGRLPFAAQVPAARLTAFREAPRNLLIREHRLYQADWLMRFYRFSPDEIMGPETSFLDSAVDPKTAWALRRLDYFPVEIKSAGYEELLRVPGIGAKSARRIVEVRRSRPLSFDGLKRLGVVLKRARYFITLGGNFLDRPDNPRRLRRILADEEEALQLPLFEF